MILLVTFPMQRAPRPVARGVHRVRPGPRRARAGRRARARSSRPCSTSAGSSGRRWPASSPRRSARARRSRIDAAHVRCISAVALLFVRRPLRAEARAEPTHILADIREGIRFVAHQPTLRAVLALWTTTSVVTAGFTAVADLLHHDRPRPGRGGRGARPVRLGGGVARWARWSRRASRPKAVGAVMLGGAVDVRGRDPARGRDARPGDGRRRVPSPGSSTRTCSSRTSRSGRCSRRTRCWAGSGRRPARSRSG